MAVLAQAEVDIREELVGYGLEGSFIEVKLVLDVVQNMLDILRPCAGESRDGGHGGGLD